MAGLPHKCRLKPLFQGGGKLRPSPTTKQLARPVQGRGDPLRLLDAYAGDHKGPRPYGTGMLFYSIIPNRLFSDSASVGWANTASRSTV